MSVTMRMRLFKNNNKEPGDNKPPYSNSNFTVQERVVLEPGVAYTGNPPVQPKQPEPEVDIPF